MNDLVEAAIRARLAELGSRLSAPISVARETGSTSDDAKAAASDGAAHGAAFLADAQTKGRGRGGHSWHSPPGENLYLSMVARPRVPAAVVAPITLAVGVAVARALEAHVPEALRVKWPNDVLSAGGKKLGGVLVEGQLRGSEVTSLVVGVGVNVHATSFPDVIAARATSLRLLGGEGLDRSRIAAELLASIASAIATFEESRLTSFLDDLARRDALLGRSVTVSGLSGLAAGIDGEGRLLVRQADGTTAAIVSGEVERWDFA